MLPSSSPLDLLLTACRYGNESTAREILMVHPELLNATALVPTTTDGAAAGETALNTASKYNCCALVTTLLELGADVNAPATDGATPLHVAAECGNEGVVDILLAHGAAVNAATQVNKTPLYFAAHNGHTSVVSALLRCGVDVDTCVHYGSTPLRAAAWYCHYDVVVALLAHGADPNLSSRTGAYPLHCAIQGRDASVVNALLQSPGIQVDSRWRGKTPLRLAVDVGLLDIVRLLHAHGADIEAVGANRSTALFSATYCRQHALVIKLLRLQADVNATDDNGQTALDLAAKRGYREIVETLLAHGATNTDAVRSLLAEGVGDIDGDDTSAAAQ